MFKKWGLGLLVGVIASLTCSSLWSAGGAGSTGAFLPTELEVAADYVYVHLAADVAAGLQNVDDCDKKDILIIPSEDPALRAEMISVALSSLSFGMPLAARISKCEPVHFGSRATAPYIDSIFMKRQ